MALPLSGVRMGARSALDAVWVSCVAERKGRGEVTFMHRTPLIRTYYAGMMEVQLGKSPHANYMYREKATPDEVAHDLCPVFSLQPHQVGSAVGISGKPATCHS